MIVLTRISLINLKNNRMNNLEYIPGDLVMVKESALQFAKDKIFKVISSLRSGFVKVVMLNDSSTTYSISNNAVRPIPLTSDILEKNGWKKEKYHDWYMLALERTLLYLVEGTGIDGAWSVCVGLNMSNIASISFIHQLQHLLFALNINHEMEV